MNPRNITRFGPFGLVAKTFAYVHLLFCVVTKKKIQEKLRSEIEGQYALCRPVDFVFDETLCLQFVWFFNPWHGKSIPKQGNSTLIANCCTTLHISFGFERNHKLSAFMEPQRLAASSSLSIQLKVSQKNPSI